MLCNNECEKLIIVQNQLEFDSVCILFAAPVESRRSVERDVGICVREKAAFKTNCCFVLFDECYVLFQSVCHEGHYSSCSAFDLLVGLTKNCIC